MTRGAMSTTAAPLQSSRGLGLISSTATRRAARRDTFAHETRRAIGKPTRNSNERDLVGPRSENKLNERVNQFAPFWCR